MKKENTTCRLGMFLLAILLSLPLAVQALAMAPGTAETNFYPNEKRMFSFELINNEDITVNVELSAKGGLAKYIEFDQRAFSLAPMQSRKIEFAVRFPAEASLPDVISITAKTPAQSPGAGTLNAYVSLTFKLAVKGEHKTLQEAEAKAKGISAEGLKAITGGFADVEIIDAKFDNIGPETAKLGIIVRNIGPTDTEVSADIKLAGGGTSRLSTMAPMMITGGATRNLISYVDVKGMPAGDYDTEISLRYADKIKKQTIKLQIIEAIREDNSSLYNYIILALLAVYNVAFFVWIIAKWRRNRKV